jgi:hypothetical protein
MIRILLKRLRLQLRLIWMPFWRRRTLFDVKRLKKIG